MRQEFEATTIVIEELDGPALGVSLKGGDTHYLCLARDEDGLYVEFNEQCNACVNRVGRIAAEAGLIEIFFRPESDMRCGNTDHPRGEPLDELAIRFSQSLKSVDLATVLADLANGVCSFERFKQGPSL